MTNSISFLTRRFFKRSDKAGRHKSQYFVASQQNQGFAIIRGESRGLRLLLSATWMDYMAAFFTVVAEFISHRFMTGYRYVFPDYSKGKGGLLSFIATLDHLFVASRLYNCTHSLVSSWVGVVADHIFEQQRKVRVA